jgi:hypothetical protein
MSRPSVRACLSATVAFYRHWALAFFVVTLLPLTLGTSLRLWRRMFAPNGDAVARAVAEAHFLTLLGITKLVPVPARILAPIASFLLPPLLAFSSSIRMARRHGAQVRRDRGIEVSTQVLEQLEIYLENPPLVLLADNRDWYYRKRLYLPALNDKRSHSMPAFGTLLGVANFTWRKKRRARGPADIDDKDFQRRRLQAASIPTVQVIGRFGVGQAEFEDGFAADRLPESGLFAKPRRNKQGRGAIAWRCIGPNRWVKEGGSEEAQSGAQVVEYLKNQKEGYILQPRLTNHPDLMDLTGDTLSSVRILTYTDPSTRSPRVFPWAWIKIPRAGAIVDNIHANHPTGVGPGMAAAVDFDTGALGPALADDFSLWTHHPDRGSAIQGRILPGWKQLVAMAEAAHRSFMPDGIAYGWDLAATGTGSVVIEGNATPGGEEEFFETKLLGEDLDNVRRLIDLCLMAEAGGS